MNFDELLNRAAELLTGENPPVAEIRAFLVDLDEAIHSAEFAALDNETRTRLQAAYSDLSAALRGSQATPAAAAGSLTSMDDPYARRSSSTPEAREHNPYAEQQMQEAEKLFYGGRYAEAIKLYDMVLQIESDWERARQHRNESENYLLTGHIPSVALPAEAATAYGKAQSAARLGRYADAMTLLKRAQAVLREMGIQRWQEGQEFEQKLQQSIDAESVYDEGLALFAQGNLDDAIERIEIAARATGMPRYNDRAAQLRKTRESVRSISEALHASNPDLRGVSAAKTALDALILEHGETPLFTRLRTRLESVTPLVVEPLKEQIQAARNQAERAETLSIARSKLQQARQLIEQARALGRMDEEMEHLQDEVERLQRETSKHEDDLQQALTVYHTNPSWPAASARLSQGVRSRFPNDPGVIELNRHLARYNTIQLAIRVGIGLVGVILVGLLLWGGVGQVRAYVMALTPSATPTATRTPPPTSTQTPLPTVTSTPRPTTIPSPTATPLTGQVARLVWARNGCYEDFTAIGKIPANGKIRFLPTERRFDKLSRECVLVEYQGAEDPVIGWILIADVK